MDENGDFEEMRTTDLQRQHAIQVACDPYENKPMRLLLSEVLRFPLTADDAVRVRCCGSNRRVKLTGRNHQRLG